MIDKLKINRKEYTKKNFSPSDFGKPTLDLWLALKGVPPTNPPEWNDTLKFGAGNGVESQMLKILKDSEIVWEHYDQDFDGRIEMEREGIKITGYIDAVTIEELGGEPIEIKSINNKNNNDIKSYEDGKPRENYVGQLSVYQDFLGKKKGNLFVGSVDGLHTFWFKNLRGKEGRFKCGEVIVDVSKEYKRWSKIWDMVQKDIKPDVFEYRYKYPLDSIDWKSISTDKIRKARKGSTVIGDWQITYSPYKDLIVEMQGDTLGYSFSELEEINKMTKGYSVKGYKN